MQGIGRKPIKRNTKQYKTPVSCNEMKGINHVFHFTTPEIFVKVLTQLQQIMWLFTHKQDKLIAGDNIVITDNHDNTYTISSQATTSVPDITATATVDETTGTPSVVVTKSGQDISPNFDFAFSGIKGEQGEQGIQGPQGEQGPQGIQGPAGPQGEQGAQGEQGIQGPQGEQGVQGPAGPQGPQGIQGPAGQDGTDGTNGTDGVSPTVTVSTITGGHQIEITSAGGTERFNVMDGVDGATGPQGPAGPQGEQGPQGIQGPAGQDGTDGATGPQGPAGPTGPQGPAGQNGTNGTDGVTPQITATASVDANSGTPAVTVTKTGTDAQPNFDFAFSNLKGPQGIQGPQGEQGIQGPQGEQGIQGPAGQNGTNGTDGVTPQITATASVDANSGTPAVTVTKTGTDAQPNFDFAFSNLKSALHNVKASFAVYRRTLMRIYNPLGSYIVSDSTAVQYNGNVDMYGVNDGTTGHISTITALPNIVDFTFTSADSSSPVYNRQINKFIASYTLPSTDEINKMKAIFTMYGISNTIYVNCAGTICIEWGNTSKVLTCRITAIARSSNSVYVYAELTNGDYFMNNKPYIEVPANTQIHFHFALS